MRKPNKLCDVCNKPHYVRPSLLAKSKSGKTFCSKTCYGISIQKPRSCVVCAKEFLASKNAITCSRICSNKNRTGIQYKTGQTKNKALSTNFLRNKMFKLRGTSCEVCAYSTNISALHVHHVIEKRNGGTDNPENLKVLCANCHYEIHS